MKPLPKRPGRPEETAKTPSADRPSAMDRPVVPTTLKSWRVAMIAAIGLVIVSGVYAYQVYLSSPNFSLSEDRVRLAAVERAPFTEFVPATGTLVPLHTVFLDTVEGGRVTEVLIEEGETVTAGTPLARLENTDLELQVMARETAYTEQLGMLARTEMGFDQTMLAYDRDLANARLAIDLTRADLERRLPRERTGVPQSEIDRLRAELTHQEDMHERISQARARDRANAERNLNQLRDSVQRMADSLELMRTNMEGLAITAPIDGQVSLLDVGLGEVIAPGARVGQIDQLDGYRLRAMLDEFYLGRLVIGQQARAEIGGEPVLLEIRCLSPSVENRQFAAELVFTSPVPQTLRRGQTLRARIDISETAETLTLPYGAYFEATGGLWVFVRDESNDTLERRPVTFGRRNPEQIEVLSGLAEGERVLVSSYDGLTQEARLTLDPR